MMDFLIYDAKVAGALLVFYLFYRFLLKKETFHRFNRIVLVGTAVLSFLLPLCIITIRRTVEMAPLAAEPLPVSIVPEQELTPAVQVSEPWWPTALTLLFWVGVAFVLARVTVSILSIAKVIRQGRPVREEDGCKVVVTERDIDPFSWMRYIVLSRKDWEAPHDTVLAHEKAHIAYRHSAEVLLVDILSALQWFNPAIWMLRADLKELHEYEADDAVLRSGADIKEYQYLLIRKAVSKSGYSVANSFNHSILKNRITMMSKSKSPLSRGLRALWLLPLVCLAIGLQARTVYVPTDKDSENNPSGNVPDPQDSLEKLAAQRTRLKEATIVKYANPEEEESLEFFLVFPDTMPAFQGGDANQFVDWVNQKLVYPRNCTHSGTMEVKFVVSADGSVRDIQVKKSICPELDATVISLISRSPKWTPASNKGEPQAYAFTIPLNFVRREPASAGKPSVVVLNIQADGRIESGGKEIPLKGLADYLLSMDLPNPGASVQINADAGTPMDVIDDVRKELRKAGALKIFYAKPSEIASVTRHLAPSVSDKRVKVLTYDEALAGIDRNDICIARINSQDRIFFGNGAYDDEDILRLGKAFLKEHGAKTHFMIGCDRATSYGAYQHLQSLLTQIYNDVRNEKAQEVYGKPLTSLSSEELSDIQRLVPMSIGEMEMKTR